MSEKEQHLKQNIMFLQQRIQHIDLLKKNGIDIGKFLYYGTDIAQTLKRRTFDPNEAVYREGMRHTYFAIRDYFDREKALQELNFYIKKHSELIETKKQEV